MSDLASFFQAGSGQQTTSRSSPGLFDRAITKQPCRAPCDDPDHVHAEDLPSGRTYQGGDVADGFR